MKAKALSLLSALPLLLSAALAAGFEEEIVSFSTHDDLVLEGIVSYPDSGDGPFPALLLIHGSGLHDADLTVNVPDWNVTNGEQRIFRKLARFFSRQGLTVLRYNKRGGSFDHTADQPEILLNSTHEDLIRDAVNAYQALSQHRMADPARMAVYGHSEGSIVAPRVVRRVGSAKLAVLVGSVSSRMEDILHFQGVEIYQMFLELAADANSDGFLTLDEFDRLDGNYGLGSFWIGTIAGQLFTLSNGQVIGLNANTDNNGDQQLHIESEILPALETIHQINLASWLSGATSGRYGQSLFEMRPNREIITKVRIPILLCQGELDFQAPLQETLDLVGVLEAKGRPYEALFFPKLGHSLSKPNDFFMGDGGLTILDNPTLNAMKKPTMRKIVRRIRALLNE
jgi:predicted esterase